MVTGSPQFVQELNQLDMRDEIICGCFQIAVKSPMGEAESISVRSRAWHV